MSDKIGIDAWSARAGVTVLVRKAKPRSRTKKTRRRRRIGRMGRRRKFTRNVSEVMMAGEEGAKMRGRVRSHHNRILCEHYYYSDNDVKQENDEISFLFLRCDCFRCW